MTSRDEIRTKGDYLRQRLAELHERQRLAEKQHGEPVDAAYATLEPSIAGEPPFSKAVVQVLAAISDRIAAAEARRQRSTLSAEAQPFRSYQIGFS